MGPVTGILTSKKLVLQGPGGSNLAMVVASDNTYNVQLGDINLFTVAPSGVLSDKTGATLITSSNVGTLVADNVATSLSGYATTADLASYVTTSALASDLSGYVTASDLGTYLTVSDLSGYVTTGDLSGYATTSDLSSYVTTSALSSAGYVTTGDLSGYATTGDISGFITSADLYGYATTSDLSSYAPTASPTFTGSLLAENATVSNLTVLGSSTIINSFITESSNLVINNLTGVGPALSVSQSSIAGDGTIAAFYDTDISTTDPVFKIGDSGLATFSSNVSVAGKLSADSLQIGGFSFVIPSDGSGGVMNIVYNGSNVLQLALDG